MIKILNLLKILVLLDNNLNKQKGDGIVYNDIQYFREIPRNNAKVKII